MDWQARAPWKLVTRKLKLNLHLLSSLDKSQKTDLEGNVSGISSMLVLVCISYLSILPFY